MQSLYNVAKSCTLSNINAQLSVLPLPSVSPSYANEILDPWYSHGLDTILRDRSYKLRGILNGIDVENYNPETDKDIFKNYNSENMRGKAVNKRELQKLLGLPEKKDTPVMGIVTRLVAHKGLDLIKRIMWDC